MVVLVISILWEFGRYRLSASDLPIHVDIITFLVYQWTIIFCLVHSFLNVSEKGEKRKIDKPPHITQVIAHTAGLDLLFNHTLRELSAGTYALLLVFV